MSGFGMDLRYSLRLLKRERGFTAAALVILALGIGANSATFSVANSLLFRPLPFKDPDRLAALWKEQVRSGARLRFSWPELAELREQKALFEAVAGYNFLSEFASSSAPGAESSEVTEIWVTPEFFQVLGVRPLMGRLFSAAELQPVSPGAPGEPSPPVVVTYDMWQTRFGGRPDVLGRTLLIEASPYTVIGVMPPDFRIFRNDRPDAFFALRPERSQLHERRRAFLNVIARWRPGVTLDRVQSEMRAYSGRAAKEHPDTAAGQICGAERLHEYLFGATRPLLRPILGVVGLVLAIACANVAGLFLVRTVRREKEFAVRMALGAGRLRLVRLLLAQSVLLSVVGGGAGLLLAMWAKDLLSSFSSRMGLGLPAIRLDAVMICFTALISMLTGVLFGLVPALQRGRSAVAGTLKESGGAISDGVSLQRWTRSLVVSEIALSMVLLIGGGLLLKTLVRLARVSPGYRPDNVLTMVIGGVAMPDRAAFVRREAGFWPELLERVRGLREVDAAAVSHAFPLSAERGSVDPRFPITLKGRLLPPPGQVLAEYQNVSPDYFRALGIPLRKGRFFEPRDLPTTRPLADLPVAIVNESLARQLWGTEDPIGRQIVTPRGEWTIVGVAGDVRQYGPRMPAPSAQVYLPLWYANFFKMGTHYLVVRTSADPQTTLAALKTVVSAIDPDRKLHLVRTMEQLALQRTAWDRLSARIAIAFGAIAVLLAALGIYALVSHSVSRRAREIGIRLALGGRPEEIHAIILRQGLRIAAAGIGLGIAAAALLSRYAAGVFYGVNPVDPMIYAVSAVTMLGITVVACHIPARSAMRIDPAITLRAE